MSERDELTVERVARALYENECRRYGEEPFGDCAWSAQNAWQLNYWRAAARVAIGAIVGG